MLILNGAKKNNTCWFALGKANLCHKFTKLKFEDTKCKHPYWILYTFVVLATDTPDDVMEVDKQLKFKSHKRMQVELDLKIMPPSSLGHTSDNKE